MDLNYLLWLQRIRETLGPVFENLMDGVSLLSTVSVFVLLVVYWAFHKQAGKFGLLCYSIGQTVNQTLKAVFCIPRPWIRNPEIKPREAAIESATGYSFPSGHTQSATSAYGALLVRYARSGPVRMLLAVMIVLIGFSRNYLGVHTPQDVLCGLAVGVFSIVFVIVLEKNREKLPDGVLVSAGVLISVLGAFFVLNRNYTGSSEQAILMMKDAMKAYGFLCGSALGFCLERRTVRFTTDGINGRQRVKRILIGAVLTAPVYLFTGRIAAVFMPVVISEYVKTFLAALVGIYAVPYVFGKIK